ncbi:MAG: TMEM175 family protein [Kosmotogaceae bacterium]
MKRESPSSEIRINRLESLTDGVFAIAMTILVLSLEVPNRSQVTSQSELVQNVMSKGYQFFSYFIPFFVIGSIWISTIRRTHILNKTDYKYLWLNMLNLFFVTTIPFTTSLLGDYGEYEFAELLFHFNILVLEIIALVQWQYLMKNRDLIREDAIR